MINSLLDKFYYRILVIGYITKNYIQWNKSPSVFSIFYCIFYVFYFPPRKKRKDSTKGDTLGENRMDH